MRKEEVGEGRKGDGRKEMECRKLLPLRLKLPNLKI